MTCHVPGCRRKNKVDIYDQKGMQWIVCEPCYEFILRFLPSGEQDRLIGERIRENVMGYRNVGAYIDQGT